MTVHQFKEIYSGDLKKFLETHAGQEFLSILGMLRPAYDLPKEEHLLIESRGAIRGYETCVRNIIGLAAHKTTVQEPEANYGVPDKTETTTE